MNNLVKPCFLLVLIVGFHALVAGAVPHNKAKSAATKGSAKKQNARSQSDVDDVCTSCMMFILIKDAGATRPETSRLADCAACLRSPDIADDPSGSKLGNSIVKNLARLLFEEQDMNLNYDYDDDDDDDDDVSVENDVTLDPYPILGISPHCHSCLDWALNHELHINRTKLRHCRTCIHAADTQPFYESIINYAFASVYMEHWVEAPALRSIIADTPNPATEPSGYASIRGGLGLADYDDGDYAAPAVSKPHQHSGSSSKGGVAGSSGNAGKGAAGSGTSKHHQAGKAKQQGATGPAKGAASTAASPGKGAATGSGKGKDHQAGTAKQQGATGPAKGAASTAASPGKGAAAGSGKQAVSGSGGVARDKVPKASRASTTAINRAVQTVVDSAAKVHVAEDFYEYEMLDKLYPITPSGIYNPTVCLAGGVCLALLFVGPCMVLKVQHYIRKDARRARRVPPTARQGVGGHSGRLRVVAGVFKSMLSDLCGIMVAVWRSGLARLLLVLSLGFFVVLVLMVGADLTDWPGLLSGFYAGVTSGFNSVPWWDLWFGVRWFVDPRMVGHMLSDAMISHPILCWVIGGVLFHVVTQHGHGVLLFVAAAIDKLKAVRDIGVAAAAADSGHGVQAAAEAAAAPGGTPATGQQRQQQKQASNRQGRKQHTHSSRARSNSRSSQGGNNNDGSSRNASDAQCSSGDGSASRERSSRTAGNTPAATSISNTCTHLAAQQPLDPPFEVSAAAVGSPQDVQPATDVLAEEAADTPSNTTGEDALAGTGSRNWWQTLIMAISGASAQPASAAKPEPAGLQTSNQHPSKPAEDSSHEGRQPEASTTQAGAAAAPVDVGAGSGVVRILPLSSLLPAHLLSSTAAVPALHGASSSLSRVSSGGGALDAPYRPLQFASAGPAPAAAQAVAAVSVAAPIILPPAIAGTACAGSTGPVCVVGALQQQVGEGMPAAASSHLDLELLASLDAVALAEAQAVAVAAAWDSTEDEDEDMLCVICLDAVRNVGLLHGDVMHLCLCSGCLAAYDHVGLGCPVCRQPVEEVVELD